MNFTIQTTQLITKDTHYVFQALIRDAYIEDIKFITLSDGTLVCNMMEEYLSDSEEELLEILGGLTGDWRLKTYINGTFEQLVAIAKIQATYGLSATINDNYIELYTPLS